MTIPVYRHNQDHDDWEVASVYDSDDCGSLGGSVYDESLHSSASLDNPALRLEGYSYDNTRPRFVNGYPVPQQQRQNHPPAMFTRPGWDTRCVPGKQSSFVVPPPGVIFPSKDWVVAPQDAYWPSASPQIARSSDMLVGVGFVETPSPPLPPALLIPPSSPPRTPAPLIKRPSPVTAIVHGRPPRGNSVTVSGTGTGAKDWVLAPQDPYWPSTTPQMASSSDMPVGAGFMETPSPPPPPALLLSPSTLPRAPSPLIKRPSPVTTIVHGQPPHGTSVTTCGTGTGANVNAHASPIMPPPPRYHEVAHAIPPRLVDAGCQAHSSMAMNPPRRSGHAVLSSYAPGPDHASMPWRPRSSEEFVVAEGRYGSGGPGGHPRYGPNVHPPPVSNKYEHERGHDGGRTRTARPQTRERRPSIWQRFVQRFNPSHVSVGQT